MMSKHFYLYGYNNRAETVQKNLIDSGMDVISIIDTNKKGSNIISPEKLKYLRNKADICVYICMQNAMQHEIVAEKLFYMGFRYIVFLPVSSKYNMQAYKMVELWNRIYEGGIDSSNEIPRYETFLKKDNLRKNNIVYAPMELVFTDKNTIDSYKKWENKHISLFKPYNQLYKCIYEGGETSSRLFTSEF